VRLKGHCQHATIKEKLEGDALKSELDWPLQLMEVILNDDHEPSWVKAPATLSIQIDIMI
jgi:hypothetical protein